MSGTATITNWRKLFSSFFLSFFYSFLFISIVWVKMAHVPWSNCTRSSTWMVWPIDLGPFHLFYLCLGGGGDCWTRKYWSPLGCYRQGYCWEGRVPWGPAGRGRVTLSVPWTGWSPPRNMDLNTLSVWPLVFCMWFQDCIMYFYPVHVSF